MADLFDFINQDRHVPTILIISPDELDQLRQNSKLIMQKDTQMSDFIRILLVNEIYIIQEYSKKGEIILRRFDSEADAREFVSARLQIYEKMWDGCGCKIDYYS